MDMENQDFSYMEETTLDLSHLSFVQDEENSSDVILQGPVQQQPANLFMPQRHQEQPQQQEELEFNAEELAAIEAINEFFESAPFFNEMNFEDQQFQNPDQSLNYLEEQNATSEESFDDESIYMDESQMYTEFGDLDENDLMMLLTDDEDENSLDMEDDDDESFHRVPSTSSVVSARYAQFPQP